MSPNNTNIPDYAELEAHSRRRRSIDEAVAILAKSYGMPDAVVQAIDEVNNHITVHSDRFDDLDDAYRELAERLESKLHWPRDAIWIYPQGSVSTQTLIRPPTSAKFDLDAICQIDLGRFGGAQNDPMTFFDQIGAAIADFDPAPEAKKRCWQIHYPNQAYSIDLTPAVPAGYLSRPQMNTRFVAFDSEPRYTHTAVAVVNRPTAQWTSSNPKGMASWVDDQAIKVAGLLSVPRLVMDAVMKARVDGLPEQRVPLSDTLRVAIRLFKRHRDMAVRRGEIRAEYQPISIVIVTLLGRCVEAMTANQRRFDNPLQLLLELADLLQDMVYWEGGRAYIPNPTARAENFAERWHEEDSARAKAFVRWTQNLVSDLLSLRNETNPGRVRERVREVFGCTDAAPSPTPGGGNGPVGLAHNRPSAAPRPIPATKGLA